MDTNYEDLLKRIAAVTPTASKLTRGDLYDLVRVVEVLAIERPNADQLWTVHRIGSYLGIDALTVERLFKTPGSPQPLEGDRGVKVWRAKDVYRWLDQHGKANLKAVTA